MGNVTTQYGIFAIEILTPGLDDQNSSKTIQVDDKEISFSNVFVENIKKTQHQNSTLTWYLFDMLYKRFLKAYFYIVNLFSFEWVLVI